MVAKLLILLLGFHASYGIELFVSPLGNDTNSGTASAPFLTLSKAQAASRAQPKPVIVKYYQEIISSPSRCISALRTATSPILALARRILYCTADRESQAGRPG
jgi:hypothetical protein